MTSNIITDSCLLDSSGQAIRIARYILKSSLGRGSSGIVYLAYDPQSRNDVVLRLNRVSTKVLDYWNQISKEILEISSEIVHESTPKLLDLGIFENSAYLVHEFIVGETIDQSLVSGSLFDGLKLLAEFKHVAEALDQAHLFGLIHSDLKPANFVINSNNNLYVLDLGMSVFRHCCSKYSDITEESSVIGTPAYLSPEQIRDRHSDASSDLFSFAAVVFKTITNQQPFDGHSYAEITNSILNENEKSAYNLKPQLGKGIDLIFSKALSKDPNQRYLSASQFILALESIISYENKPLRSTAATIVNPTSVLVRADFDHINKNEHKQNSTAIFQNNYFKKQNDNALSPRPKLDLKSGSARIAKTALTLSPVSVKNLLLLVFLFGIFFLGLIALALYPRSTTLVLEDDPAISKIYTNNLSSGKSSAENDKRVTEKIIHEQDSTFKRAEAKAVVESIMETNSQDVILPELLQKFQSNPVVYQDINFARLFNHQSYLVKVSVIKKVIAAKVVDYLPQVRLSLSDADPLVRGFAVKAIGILGSEADKDLLIKAIATEKQSEVKQAMNNALKRLESSVIH